MPRSFCELRYRGFEYILCIGCALVVLRLAQEQQNDYRAGKPSGGVNHAHRSSGPINASAWVVRDRLGVQLRVRVIPTCWVRNLVQGLIRNGEDYKPTLSSLSPS